MSLLKALRSLQEVEDPDHDHEGHDDHEDHDEEGGGGGLTIENFKIIMIFALILCIATGIIPKVWPACRKSETALSFLNCFSAGIFLSMALIHMMPEAAEIYESWAKKEGIERAFPLPYVGFFLGYLLILAVDRVIAKAFGYGHDHGGGHGHGHGGGHGHGHGHGHGDGHSHGHGHSHGGDETPKKTMNDSHTKRQHEIEMAS